MDPNFAELSKPPPWRPEVFFLYGALADPAFLQRLLCLPEPPIFGEATILNAVMKRQGAFPVLTKMDVPNPNLLVTGKIYTVTKEEHVARLTQFVGPKFRLAPCLIKGTEGKWPSLSWSFVWEGPPEELEDLADHQWGTTR